MDVSEVPLIAGPQALKINLGGTDYRLRLTYLDVPDGGYVLDIADVAGVPIVQGLPLVTGVDLLAQYRHLGFVGSLIVQSDGDPDTEPTFENLGDGSHLYFVVATT